MIHGTYHVTYDHDGRTVHVRADPPDADVFLIDADFLLSLMRDSAELGRYRFVVDQPLPDPEPVKALYSSDIIEGTIL